MKLAVIGAGNVGGTLGRAFARAGHSVLYGVRDPGDVKHAALAHVGAEVSTVRAAVTGSDAVVLATPWNATEPALVACRTSRQGAPARASSPPVDRLVAGARHT